MEYIRLIYVFIFTFHRCICFEPMTTTMGAVTGVAVSIAYTTWDLLKCRYQECCDSKWIKLNIPDLLSHFKRSIHGQHLAEQIIPQALRRHTENKNPQKALVMSFHGSSGIGKNFVSQYVAEHLYHEGMKSKFVHLYISTIHFPHKSRVEEYCDKLQREIKEATMTCERSLFIFDEIDKMPSEVIDILKPYMDYYSDIEGVDYRKNIFIFLSNTGSKEIAKTVLSFWADGKERDEITLKDIEPIINKGIFNETGGLQHSTIIERNLIDFYVPFLPLERQHVKLCIRDRLRARFQLVDNKLIDKITDEITYCPQDLELFSESGCKRLDQKIDIYVND